jgi:hypothetical protein
MLEDNRELAVNVAASRAAKSDVMANHRLQLERDMLDDVGSVCPALESSNESPALTNAAAVLFQARHHRNERLSESGNVG